MKSALLAAVIALLFVSWAHAQEEDEPPTCPTGNAYIWHVNCTKYYQCSNYVPFERECPLNAGGGTLYWNHHIYECDDPDNVLECVGGTRPPWEGPGPTTEMPPPTTTGTPPTTTTPTTTTQTPPTTTTLTTTTQTPPTTTTLSTTTLDPSICDDPDRIYFLPDPTDTTCTQYIACYMGFPTQLRCAEGLLFNPAEGQCVRPENYQCPNSTTTTQAPTSTSTTTQPPTTTSQAPTTTSTTTQLPTTTSTTTQPPTTTPTTTQPPTTTMEPPRPTTEDLFPCPHDVPYIYMPHYASCYEFYVCIEGVFGGHLSCGDFLHFNFDFQGCIPPDESDCVEPPLP